jgi:glutamyl-Q tRNA(Asp) synthetase
METLPYRGRFAPSPTGPLHFGSLVAALGSCLDARAAGGQWLLRIEDVDQPRCPRENAENIFRTLAAFGFEWDAEPLWQSRRSDIYGHAFEKLQAAGGLFPCACSRRELADSVVNTELNPALAADGALIYPGTCRSGLPDGRMPRAWRLRVGLARIGFDDRLQGRIEQDLARDVGDFILLRADGYFAYQLAVVVDDAEQGITDVVRGADLLDSTPRQILLQQRLGLAQPRYAHLPVAVTASGEKLSKQTGAAALDSSSPVPILVTALEFLGQSPPLELSRASIAEVWSWARQHWRLDRVNAGGRSRLVQSSVAPSRRPAS